ncbi:MAG TPA: hypothetical protein VGG14_16800 [Candidatus Sulfotelmatobacter sp.]
MSNSLQHAKKHWPWKWIGIVALVCLVLGLIAVRSVIHRAQPILRARVIDTLTARFQSRVDLASLNVSVLRGLEVSGTGLKIFGKTDPNPYEPGVQPLMSIDQFHFHTGIRTLFGPQIHVDTVYVKGMNLNIPPKGSRADLTNMSSGKKKMTVFVDKFICQDTNLLINTSKPGKPPLEFAIHDLRMKDIGPGQPMSFDATLVNPKPVGDIHSTGLFGPWNVDDPRDTPVQGDYSFSHADLGTIKGIGGILSSTGKYEGMLSNIVVNGTTDTPDFQIRRSGHPMPLHTEFHAIVDGTNGDTQLEPVKATLLHSSFTAKGSIIREQNPHGHDIELDVVLNNARIQDLLELGVRTNPPIMTGPVEMTTKLSLPPGSEDVIDRLKLAGSFHMPSAHFTNEKVQSKIDSLSLRTQGKPKQAKEQSEQEVPVDLRGVFALANGTMNFSLVHFQIPGTHVDMAGVYSMDGKTFDFHGTAKLEAKLSQMTTGWKSILLKPVDPFFRKDGAGTEVPIKVTGTESEPHFGLDFGHKDEQKPQGKNLESSTER